MVSEVSVHSGWHCCISASGEEVMEQSFSPPGSQEAEKETNRIGSETRYSL
jgi:hypothetical protein